MFLVMFYIIIKFFLIFYVDTPQYNRYTFVVIFIHCCTKSARPKGMHYSVPLGITIIGDFILCKRHLRLFIIRP